MTQAIVLMMGLASGLPAADKVPGLPPSDLFFQTGKGGTPENLERFVPGIVAALQLTAEQRQALMTARDDVFNSEIAQKARELKGNTKATEAEREAVRKAMTAAREKMREKVADTLTSGQRVLIEKMSRAVTETRSAVQQKYQEEFVAAKGDDAKAKQLREQLMSELRTELGRKLGEILTPEQQAAVEKAAKEQEAASSKAKPK